MVRKSLSQSTGVNGTATFAGKGFGRSGERKGSKSSKVITQEDILHAIESLYDDEICPHSRILKRRLVELKVNTGLRTIDINTSSLHSAVSACLRLRVSDAGCGDWMALLCDRPSNFVDVHNPSDEEYPPQLLPAFGAYVASLADREDPEEYRLPSSRYACARALHSCQLPFFEGYSLGRICHIVQLAISQKSIFGYRDGALVPYAMSRCLQKKQHAEYNAPVSIVAGNCSALPFADWSTTRACMAEIMEAARYSTEGAERLANIKRIFRARYELELSETMLGHTKLSELLSDPQLHDLCRIELRNGGYAVVPAELMSVPAADQYCNAPPTDCGAMGAEQYDGVSATMEPMHVNAFGLQLNLAPEPAVDPAVKSAWKAAPWQLSPSKVCKDGNVTRVPGGEHGSMVKNTFIDQIATPLLRLRKGCQRRARSVPKDMFSRKSEWESACHILGYQNCPVRNDATRKVILEKQGQELGLNVVFDSDANALLIDDVGPGLVQNWNQLNKDEPISIGDRILEVNGVKGNVDKLLEQCKESDILELVIQPAVQTTARSDSNDSQATAKSLPPPSMMEEMCRNPLETPTWDGYISASGYEFQGSIDVGLQGFPDMTPQIVTNSGWLQGNGSSELSLHLGDVNAADLSNMPLETPTFDRHVPAMHVSCRAADTDVFVEQSSEQPAVRSWIVPDLTASDMNEMCSMATLDVNDFYGVTTLAPELSIKMPDVNDLCGVPLETPTLDNRYAPTVAIRLECDGPRQGMKLSLADYLQ